MILSLDIYLFRLINGLAGQSKFLDFIGIFLASSLAYVLVLAVVIIVLTNKSWRVRLNNLLFLALTLLSSTGFFASIIRFIYARPRPPLALEGVTVLINKNLAEASFPSDHAVFFFALAIVIYFIKEKWFRYFFVSAILMGVARVFVGVHYPMDVVAGAIIGLGTGLLVHKIYSYNDKI